MTPYSRDLRQRIVDTVMSGDGTVSEVAERFLVSIAFVTRLLQLDRATGSVEPRPYGGGHPAVLSPEDFERLREYIRDRPDVTLEECREHLGSSCSLPTISRALSELGLPRKKKVPRAAEQGRPEVQDQRGLDLSGFIEGALVSSAVAWRSGLRAYLRRASLGRLTPVTRPSVVPGRVTPAESKRIEYNPLRFRVSSEKAEKIPSVEK